MCWRGMLKVSATVSESKALNFEKRRDENAVKTCTFFLGAFRFLEHSLEDSEEHFWNICPRLHRTRHGGVRHLGARHSWRLGEKVPMFLEFLHVSFRKFVDESFVEHLIISGALVFRCLLDPASWMQWMQSIHSFFSPRNRLFFFWGPSRPRSSPHPKSCHLLGPRLLRAKCNGNGQAVEARRPGVFERKIHLSHISHNPSFWLKFFFFWDVVDRGSMFNYIHGCFCFPIFLF